MDYNTDNGRVFGVGILLIAKQPTKSPFFVLLFFGLFPFFSVCFFLALLTFSFARAEEPQASGKNRSGLINMPNARVAPDGTLNLGYFFAKPYAGQYVDLTFLPRVEVRLSYNRIMHVPGFTDPQRAATFGDFKDKSFDGKVLLLQESDMLPALAVGANDVSGTKVFSAQYIALSKGLGSFDATLGYGRRRIDGVFGGVRYSPEQFKSLSFVAEYDANNYKLDFGSDLSGAAKFKKGPSYGIEYKWGWLGTQISYQHNEIAFNGYFSIPLNQKDFIAKFEEPAPYTKIIPRPTAQQWQDDPGVKRLMVEALFDQDFRNIRIRYENGMVDAVLTNARISTVSRSIGRAARTILLLAPVEAKEIRITYTVRDLPIATYTFFDLGMLQRYYNGMIARFRLAEYVTIDYASPLDGVQLAQDKEEALDAFDKSRTNIQFLGDEGDFISFKREDSLLNQIKVRPLISAYFNDPSGAFRYGIDALVTLNRHLGEGLYLNTASTVNLTENISQVTQPSNSLLPHVRTDVADYKRVRGPKLITAVVNKFYQPEERVYTRASVGIYEEMFAGAGGQVLYIPQSARWGIDVSVDALRQRDIGGGFDFRSYTTIQALVSTHYRLPFNLTGTARVGQFLAKDQGVRLELKRRFGSGFEIGGWMSFTNGNDITSPGSPGKPYHDKGVFMLIPINSMLTKDTQASGGFSIAAWTRDVAQMVASPGDLFDMMEKPLLIDVKGKDGLTQLGDRNDDYNIPSPVVPLYDRPIGNILKSDLRDFRKTLSSEGTVRALGIGVGIIALSSTLDKPIDRLVSGHTQNSVSKGVSRVGNYLPFAGLAVAGVLALGPNDPRVADTSVSALEAGVLAGAMSYAGKYALGRSRPDAEKGRTDFHLFSAKNANASFPSAHTAVIWGVVTPYAKEYEMPWLYGVAALTNVGRIANRQHWFSDTVGGSLLGYALGSLIWHYHRNPDRTSPQLLVTGNGVAVSWDMK